MNCKAQSRYNYKIICGPYNTDCSSDYNYAQAPGGHGVRTPILLAPGDVRAAGLSPSHPTVSGTGWHLNPARSRGQPLIIDNYNAWRLTWVRRAEICEANGDMVSSPRLQISPIPRQSDVSQPNPQTQP